MKTPAQVLLQNSNYSALLSTDEWLAYSARIRASKGGLCESCRLGDRPTQVHHIFYDGRKPWEYHQDDVVLLCDTCHKELHEQLQFFRRFVFHKLTPHSFKILNQALADAFSRYNSLVFSHALSEFSGNERLVESHAKAWGLRLNGTPVNEPKTTPVGV